MDAVRGARASFSLLGFHQDLKRPLAAGAACGAHGKISACPCSSGLSDPIQCWALVAWLLSLSFPETLVKVLAQETLGCISPIVLSRGGAQSLTDVMNDEAYLTASRCQFCVLVTSASLGADAVFRRHVTSDTASPG